MFCWRCLSIHPCNENQFDALFIHGFFRQATSTCFGYICSPSSGGILHTGCPRRNVPDFWRVFLMLKYTDVTQNTYVQSWTVTEIMAREKCGLLAGPRTVPLRWQPYPCPSLSVVSYYGNSAHASYVVGLYQNAQSAMLRQCWAFMCHV